MNEQLMILFFGSILSVIGTVLVLLFNSMRTDIKSMGGSIDHLNVQIAEVIKDQKWHKEELGSFKQTLYEDKKEISKIKERLHKLEGGQAQVLDYINNN